MNQRVVVYEASKFQGEGGSYTLYFFYRHTNYQGEWCWLWDDNKLLLNEALKLYPKTDYIWQELSDDV